MPLPTAARFRRAARVVAVIVALVVALPPGSGRAEQAQRAGTLRSAVPAGHSVRGIDVSNHQAIVAWPAVAAAGAAFAYAKATEGTYFVDPYFAGNYTGAKAAGLLAGAYHYARPDQSGGAAQADYFLDHAGYVNDGRTMLPMLDVEWPWAGSGSPSPCYGLSTGAMVTWIRSFVNEVAVRTGQRTMIYTNTNWWNPCTGGDTSFGDNPLFIANYGPAPVPLPAGWSRWTLWQYASAGDLPGDQDVFNGTSAGLAELTGGLAPPGAGTLPPASTIQYPVAGDWDGNGTTTPGVVCAAGGVLRWYLRQSNTTGGATVVFSYGDANMIPIVGDWDGNGTVTPGAVRAEHGVLRWYLRNSNTTGTATVPAFSYGDGNMRPVPGDWDGNGTVTPGAVRAESSGLRWYLRNSNTTGTATVPAFSYGDGNMRPVPGDWDGNGSATPGVVRAEWGLLRWYLRNSNAGGVATVPAFYYGAAAGPLPLL